MAEIALQYTVFGRVIPERVAMGANQPLLATVEWPGKTFKIELSFTQSHITAKLFCEGDVLSNGEILSAVRQLAGRLTTFLSFKLCATYQIAFDSMVRHFTGQAFPISVIEPIFGDQEKSNFLYSPTKEFEPISFEFEALANPNISVALEELNTALIRPALTAMHCYICLEYVKALYPEGQNDKDREKRQWIAMRTDLNVSRDAIMEIEKLAKDMKHGSIGHTTWDQRKRCMQIAWEVLHRKILRINGNQEAFPELN